MGRRTEQRIPVPHHRPVLQPPQRVHLAVVHDHDYRETRCRAFARQQDREEVGKLGGETGLAPQQGVVGEKEATATATLQQQRPSLYTMKAEQYILLLHQVLWHQFLIRKSSFMLWVGPIGH